MTIFLGFFIIRTLKIATLDDPFFSMTHMGVESTIIDLTKLEYFFAIESLDPRIGRVKVSQRRWNADAVNEKQKIEVTMEDCREFQEGGKYAYQVTDS